jgi:hypothetical protein
VMSGDTGCPRTIPVLGPLWFWDTERPRTYRNTRLVLFNLEAVILKLNVRLRTLPLPTVKDSL